MANAGTDERAAQRPLSPHLTIFKPWLTMAMSMAHRISGAGLYVGMALMGLYLLGAGFGGWLHALTGWLASGLIGGLIVFVISWAIFQHIVGGIRHALWARAPGRAVRCEAGLNVACVTKVFRRARTRSRPRAASPRRSATWGRTTGNGTCTTPSRGRTGWATRTRSIYLCRNAPQAVYELEHWGVPFSRTE